MGGTQTDGSELLEEAAGVAAAADLGKEPRGRLEGWQMTGVEGVRFGGGIERRKLLVLRPREQGSSGGIRCGRWRKTTTLVPRKPHVSRRRSRSGGDA